MKSVTYRVIKRVFDLTFVLFGVAVVFFPAVLAAVLIKVTSRGPVLFWSERVGKGGRLFLMPKFRSMNVSAPVVATHELPHPSAHLTTVGSLLRSTSLDEIPQLWSIAKGDMSVVGPRPALFNQADLIQLRRESGIQKIKPGLTGWAQINGRDELTINEKVALDLEYMRNQGFLFDLYICVLTAVKLVKRTGVSH